MQTTYLIGIDLGTTNSVVAYADLRQATQLPQLFEIEQLIGAGKVAKRAQLPSFRYHPTEGEIALQDMVLPWHDKPLEGELSQVIIGEWARELGAKVEGRLVSSAKSWLSHAQVDRSAAILPWASAEGVAKVSPVLASASYLNYIRQAWNHEHPEHTLETQEVIITVPASFDEAARALTVEAANMAGLTNILLLEEPQAVCYDWYTRHRDRAHQLLNNIKLLLVCDVGGGTTDLSLIQVQAGEQDLALKRIGVGDHLMLGGDNIDFALAHIAEQRITQNGAKLNAASLAQLVQQTRKAKELLLSAHAPERCKVTVLGSGSRLIGGAKSCELEQQEVHNIALDGFFPNSAFSELPNKRRSAIVEFGLPYVADPAISKHIAEFLSRHHQACCEALGSDQHAAAIPDAILLNGGVFNSPELCQQILQVLGNWRGQALTQLENAYPDLAVAYGAVGYGLARRGAQLKISGGSARSYFLQLEAGQGICILPKGSEENSEAKLTQHKFALRLGQPVVFHLFSSTDDTRYQLGQLCSLDDCLALPPLVVVLDGNKQEVPVELVTTLTEVGTLQLDCVSNNNERWNVEFEIRQNVRRSYHAGKLPANFDSAAHKVSLVYGQSNKDTDPNAVKLLRNELDKLLGDRDAWDTALLRALCDVFINGLKKRRRSMPHERMWFNLAGFCLRPGTGFPLDDWRIQQLWPLYEQGLQFPQEQPSWAAWWTFWRRAAGGLNQAQQQRIYQDIAPFINPANKANNQKAWEELLRLAAVLENISIADKTQLATWLLKRLQKASETPTAWWTLGRLCTRIPFYGSAHNVLPKETLHQWLPQLLKGDWKSNQHQAFAIVMLARRSGDRIRDLDEPDLALIIDKLKSSKVPNSWIQMVEQVTELDDTESQKIFGDVLPVGLRLVKG